MHAMCLQVQCGPRCCSLVGRDWVGIGRVLNFNIPRAWGRPAQRSLLRWCLYALTSKHQRCVYLSAKWRSCEMPGVPPCRSERWYDTSEWSHPGQGGNRTAVPHCLSCSSAWRLLYKTWAAPPSLEATVEKVDFAPFLRDMEVPNLKLTLNCRSWVLSSNSLQPWDRHTFWGERGRERERR